MAKPILRLMACCVLRVQLVLKLAKGVLSGCKSTEVPKDSNEHRCLGCSVKKNGGRLLGDMAFQNTGGGTLTIRRLALGKSEAALCKFLERGKPE